MLSVHMGGDDGDEQATTCAAGAAPSACELDGMTGGSLFASGGGSGGSSRRCRSMGSLQASGSQPQQGPPALWGGSPSSEGLPPPAATTPGAPSLEAELQLRLPPVHGGRGGPPSSGRGSGGEWPPSSAPPGSAGPSGGLGVALRLKKGKNMITHIHHHYHYHLKVRPRPASEGRLASPPAGSSSGAPSAEAAPADEQVRSAAVVA